MHILQFILERINLSNFICIIIILISLVILYSKYKNKISPETKKKIILGDLKKIEIFLEKNNPENKSEKSNKTDTLINNKDTFDLFFKNNLSITPKEEFNDLKLKKKNKLIIPQTPKKNIYQKGKKGLLIDGPYNEYFNREY